MGWEDDLVSAQILVGRKIVLRPFLRDEAQILFDWMLDSEVSKFFDIKQSSVSATEAWIERTNKAHEHILWGIEYQENLIGRFILQGINQQHLRASTNVLIGEKTFWRKGFARDAVLTAVAYAFNDLRLEKISARMNETNIASVALHEACGFVLDARLDREAVVDSRRVDKLVYKLFCPTLRS